MLTSAGAGGAELVTRGRNGWVVPAPSAEAIAEGLRALRESDGARLAQAARASAEPFTYQTQPDAFETLYQQLKP